jgi:hypothetical protein
MTEVLARVSVSPEVLARVSMTQVHQDCHSTPLGLKHTKMLPWHIITKQCIDIITMLPYYEKLWSLNTMVMHNMYHLIPQHHILELHRQHHNNLVNLIWARSMIIHREIGSSCHHKCQVQGWNTPLSWWRLARRCWRRIRGDQRRF